MSTQSSPRPPSAGRTRRPKGEPPALVSVAEAARLLGIAERTLWRQIGAGAIMRVKVGRRALVPRAEVDRIAHGG